MENIKEDNSIDDEIANETENQDEAIDPYNIKEDNNIDDEIAKETENEDEAADPYNKKICFHQVAISLLIFLVFCGYSELA